MGAPNFGRVAADKIYALWMSQEVEVLDEDGMPTGETEYESPERWEIEEDIEEYFQQEFKDTFKPTLPKGVYASWNGEFDDLFTLSSSKCYKLGSVEVEIEAKIEANIQSGYHEGACLDFTYVAYVDGYRHADSWDSSENISIDKDYFHDLNKTTDRKAKQVEKWAEVWVRKELDVLAAHVNKFFSHICGDKLIKVAQFSNGEAVYQKVV